MNSQALRPKNGWARARFVTEKERKPSTLAASAQLHCSWQTKRNMAHKQSFGLPLAVLILAGFGASISGFAMVPASRSTDMGSPAAAHASGLASDWLTPESTGTGLANVTNTTALNQTINPSGAIVLSANVDSGNAGPAPTGTVTFVDSTLDQNVATVALEAGTGENSTATITVTGILAPGSHQIEAHYSGDLNYAPADSAPVTVEVELTSTTTTVVPATTTPAAGTSLAVTATVTPTAVSTADPTGGVTFLLDGVSQGTGTVTATSPSTASFTIPVIAAGTHALTATYSGDTNYATSTSASVSITAAQGATVITVKATPPILAAGTAETLTATVAPAASLNGIAYTITGTVNFYDNGTTLLGTAAVAGNVATLAGVSLANNISHSITAVYSGDINWLPSTSTALALAATTLPDSVVLTSNLATLTPGQSTVLTVTVTPTSTPALDAEQNPTGSVVFYDGVTTIGTAALAAAPVGDSSIATLTTQTLPGGQDVISAIYGGDLYYDAGTSNLLALDIQDFTIVPSATNPPTNLNIVQGASGSAGFVITGLGGFTGAVQVVCSVAAQDNMTCTTTPQQITPPGTATFVIQTFLPGQQSAASHGTPTWPRAAGGAALAILGFFLLPFGRRTRIFTRLRTRRLLTLLLLLAGFGGAGIGCSTATAVNGTGTPLGVATLKITASANVDNTVVSHSVYLTVNVVTPTSTQ
jgi:hypothetical protein